MDKIINILLLIIIFVFDPLAISLVVAANFAFDQARPKKNLYNEEVYEEPEPVIKKKVQTEIKINEERMNIIGQNGNDGLHYEPQHDGYMLDNDNIWKTEEVKTGYELEGNIDRIIQKGPKYWKVLLKSGEVIKALKREVQEAITNDDNNSTNYKLY